MQELRRRYVLAAVLAIVLALLLTLIIVDKRLQDKASDRILSITIECVDPSNTKSKYTKPVGNASVSSYAEYYTFDYSTFTEEYSTYMQETSILSDVSLPNVALYNMCDRYFNVYFGDTKLSPLVPLAIANVETPGRADHSVTWSALFPSGVVPIELLDTMDVTTVVSNPEYFAKLSKESSTRDRGALQMSPSYGTGNDQINALMSGSEKDKLSSVDCSSYAAWASGASSMSGDRFYLPDVLLRLSAAFTDASEDMARNNYLPESDVQAYVMCAMYHHRSGVWTNKAHGGKTWNSSALAYEYSNLISTEEFLHLLEDYRDSHTDVYTIDNKVAMSLLKEVCPDPYKYSSSNLVLGYPVKCLYAYVKLAKLYGG